MLIVPPIDDQLYMFRFTIIIMTSGRVGIIGHLGGQSRDFKLALSMLYREEVSSLVFTGGYWNDGETVRDNLATLSLISAHLGTNTTFLITKIEKTSIATRLEVLIRSTRLADTQSRLIIMLSTIRNMATTKHIKAKFDYDVEAKESDFVPSGTVIKYVSGATVSIPSGYFVKLATFSNELVAGDSRIRKIDWLAGK